MTKVIIPVAGAGVKLRPHTHTQPKTLVPIAGKPILAHIVDGLIEEGITEFIFILGYLGDKIEEFIIERYPNPELEMRFVVQEPREGSAHAIWVCREYLQDEEEILVVLGDTIASFNLADIVKKEQSVLGVKKVANPLLFGIAETNLKGQIKRLIEKPRIPKSNLALVGIYKLKNIPLLLKSIKYLLDNDIQTANEYHLTDALMHMIEQGEPMQAFEVDNWFDCGKKEALLEANAILLNTPKYQHLEQTYPNTIIIPPVSIGENCQIAHSVIGPNVAIGDNTIMDRVIVCDSIIGSYSELANLVLKHSIIGNDTALRGLTQSLNIGDNTEINFSK